MTTSIFDLYDTDKGQWVDFGGGNRFKIRPSDSEIYLKDYEKRLKAIEKKVKEHTDFMNQHIVEEFDETTKTMVPNFKPDTTPEQATEVLRHKKDRENLINKAFGESIIMSLVTDWELYGPDGVIEFNDENKKKLLGPNFEPLRNKIWDEAKALSTEWNSRLKEMEKN
jgi:hypothetical protein